MLSSLLVGTAPKHDLKHRRHRSILLYFTFVIFRFFPHFPRFVIFLLSLRITCQQLQLQNTCSKRQSASHLKLNSQNREVLMAQLPLKFQPKGEKKKKIEVNNCGIIMYYRIIMGLYLVYFGTAKGLLHFHQ